MAASIKTLGSSDTWLWVAIAGLSPTSNGRDRQVQYFFDGQIHGTPNMITNVDLQYHGDGGEHEFTGLSPGTTYQVKAVIYTYSDNGSSYTTEEVTANLKTTGSAGSVRPNNWAWSPPITAGSEIRISAAHWNAFCSRINAFRVFADLSPRNFTPAQTGQEITSWRAISVAGAIYDMTGGPVPAPQVGDPITAAFFNDLRDRLNSVG